MFWVVYYCLALLANIALLFIFGKHLSISAISLVPVFLIALSAFQAVYFKKEKTDDGFSTAYGSGFTHKEESMLMRYASYSLLATIPLLVPFVFFFGTFIKTLSVFVYIGGFAFGLVLYRIKHNSQLKRRIDEETKRRNEQNKRENEGEYK